MNEQVSIPAREGLYDFSTQPILAGTYDFLLLILFSVKNQVLGVSPN